MDEKQKEALEKIIPLIAKILWESYSKDIVNLLIKGIQKTDNKLDDMLIPLLERFE